MGDRLTAHCKSLQQIDWSGSRDQANDYIVLLVKETVTLHKVLSRYLQEGVLEASDAVLGLSQTLTASLVYHDTSFRCH